MEHMGSARERNKRIWEKAEKITEKKAREADEEENLQGRR